MKIDAVVKLVDGKPTVRELLIVAEPGDPPISADTLRSIRISEVVSRAVAPRSTLLDAELLEQVRRDGPVPETLRVVAEVYMAALAAGQPPTKTVQDTFAIKRYTADRWVAKAREQGCLGKALGAGRAGARVTR